MQIIRERHMIEVTREHQIREITIGYKKNSNENTRAYVAMRLVLLSCGLGTDSLQNTGLPTLIISKLLG